MGHKRTVRKDTLRCSTCKRWQPDDAYGPSEYHPSRRNRRYQCRECEARVKREKRSRA